MYKLLRRFVFLPSAAKDEKSNLFTRLCSDIFQPKGMCGQGYKQVEKIHRMTKVDPRFRRVKKTKSKVKVDERFTEMFEDKDFVSPINVDKYGKSVEGRGGREELERFYHLEESDTDGGEDGDGIWKKKEKIKAFSGSDAERQEEPSSSESDSDSEDEERQLAIIDQPHPLVEDVAQGEATKRLAVMNINWDQINAKDIYTLSHAFKPPTGEIIKVEIFISAFGKERLQRERLEGPSKDLFGSDEESNQVALRRYQIERMRYYYAVITCDEAHTAACIYQNCDGSELEKSSNFLDFRYIPDSVEFSPEDLHDECDVLPKTYKPRDTLSTPHSSIQVNWDEDSAERKKLLQGGGAVDWDEAEADIQAYLATASSDDENEGKAERYRVLFDLDGGEDDEGSVDMQVTFDDWKESDDSSSTEAQDDQESSATATSLNDKTPYQKYMEKLASRKQNKKADKANKTPSEKPSSKKTKRAKSAATNPLSLMIDDDGQEAEIEVDDERFGDIYNDAQFALDPTHPSFKKTKVMSKIISERQKRNKPTQ